MPKIICNISLQCGFLSLVWPHSSAKFTESDPLGESLMKSTIKITLLSTALAMLALPVVAQTTSPAPVTGESIQDRKENQQDRIANGVKSGELTAGETGK